MGIATMRTIITLALLLLAGNAAQQPAATVGLVSEVSGDVRVVSAQGEGAPLARLSWLTEGSRVTAARNASAVVVFWSGKRWRIEPDSAARIAKDALVRVTGRVSELTAFPPMPHLPSIAPESVRTGGYGAVRVRGGIGGALYPTVGTTTLAATTRLTFEPRNVVGGYQIEVLDASGAMVFQTRSSDTTVAIPPAVLAPGARYTWSMRPAANPRAVPARGEFTTLDAATEKTRAAMRAARRADDGASLALLAELDLMLGLLAEARAGFEEALASAPDDAVLQRRVEDLRKAMVPSGAQ
jgi:hypothetical protein